MNHYTPYEKELKDYDNMVLIIDPKQDDMVEIIDDNVDDTPNYYRN